MKRVSFSHIVHISILNIIILASSSFCQKPIDLRFAWWGNDSRHKVTLEAIELFKKKYPHINVKAEYSGWTGYTEKVTTSIMGRNAADLMQINWNMLYTFGAESFLDLKKSGLDLNVYSPDLIKQCTIDDKVVGIPMSTNGRLFYYNKTTFDKAGIAIPKSFADLYSAAAQFKTKLGKDYYPLLLSDYDSWLISLMYCEQKYNKPFITGNRVALTVDELKSGLDFFKDLVAKGVAPSIAETQSAGAVPFDQDQRWITGKYAGKYDWSATATKVAGSAANSEIIVGETPMDFGKKPGCIYKISFCYSMYSKTKYPKETALLFNFLLTDPEAVKIQGLERGVPSNSIAEKILDQAGFLKGLAFEADKAATKSAGMGINPHFEDPELQNFYRSEIMQALEKIGSKAAAEKAIAKTNEFLKEVENL